jgi:DNA-binding CsgD family transcriptional regulator
LTVVAWHETYDSLAALESPTGEQLDLCGMAAYMLGRQDECVQQLERAFRAHTDAGDDLQAARSAFWIGMQLALRGEMGPAGGWLGRAQRIVDAHDGECVERGYLLLPVAFQHEAAGDLDGAIATAAAAGEVGERLRHAELLALALHLEGEYLLQTGRIKDGLARLDEAMVAVAAGELTPIATGVVYCGVILACEGVFELRRAREWTAVLTRWCAEQEDLIAFSGRCLAHQAQVMQLHGEWRAALEAAADAAIRSERSMNQAAVAKASYLQADVRRLRGEFPEAEELYKEASRLGLEPQPGLALLRLAQGNRDAALAAIRRAAGEAGDPLKKAALLPALAEIALSFGELDEARAACDELERSAEACDSDLLRALHAHARGAVELAAGKPGDALAALRRARALWQELEAPYELARTRVLIGIACRELGDEESFTLELDAARRVFEGLDAQPDLAALDASSEPGAAHGLSTRELEVLRLVATGKSNREIAKELVISEHTVARHVQNILAKLRVGSRTAAGAFAYEHDLV